MSDLQSSLNRRELLHLAAATGSLATLPGRASADDVAKARFAIIDTNISLFHWPFRRLPLNETEQLVATLRSLGVTQAWAGSFEGILHRDVSAVNQRLADECRQFAELIPFGTINLASPGWEADLRQCFETHQMPGIRLFPNYHAYKLTNPRLEALLNAVADAGRLTQIAVSMEDTRMQHPLVPVRDVDLKPLTALLMKVPTARVQLLNHRLRLSFAEMLAKNPGLYLDTARVEGTDGIPKLIHSLPGGRVLFGSHAPFLIPQAAMIRTHESGQLTDDELAAVLSGNAKRFLRSIGV